MLFDYLKNEKLPIEYGWRVATHIYLRRLLFFGLFVFTAIIGLFSLGTVPVYILMPLLSLLLLAPSVLLIFSTNEKFRDDASRIWHRILERARTPDIDDRRPRRERRANRTRVRRPIITKETLRFGSRVLDFAVTSFFLLLIGGLGVALWYLNSKPLRSTASATPSQVVNLPTPSDIADDTEPKVIYTPDGGSVIVGLEYIGAYVFNAPTFGIASTLPISKPHDLSLSADGRTLAVAASNTEIEIRRWPSAEVMRTIKTNPFISHIALSPDGSFVAAAYLNFNYVTLWRTSDGAFIKQLEGHIDPVNGLAFSPDSSMLALGSEDQTVSIWRTQDASRIVTVGTQADNLQVISTASGSSVSRRLAKDAVLSVAFSPDGSSVAAGTLWGEIKLWSIPDGTFVRTFAYIPVFNDGKGFDIGNVVFSPDGSLIAAGLDVYTVLWKVEDGQQYSIMTGHTDLVRSVAFSPNGKTIVSASFDHTMRIWPIRPRDNS